MRELPTAGRGLGAPPSRAPTATARRLQIDGAALGAAVVAAAFVLVSCWWLSRDRGLPYADNASHLVTAVAYRDMLMAGDFGEELWTRSGYYPPLSFLVGAVGLIVGGMHAWAPVLAQDLAYVPLLAAGCFGTGRMLAGSRAGLLAVVFALGSPLIAEQFHVFMIDAPLTALVATAVWLILLSRRFARVGLAALAGVAVGAGLASKSQFPIFVAGMLLVVLVRGGWRNWRGLLAFAAAALLVGAPWYLVNLDRLAWLLLAAGSAGDVPIEGRPPMFSIANATWYAWAILNALLFAPLCLFALAGVVHAVGGLGRVLARRAPLAAADVRPELLGGLLVAWLGLTLIPHHDLRYAMPLIVYLAVLGTAWIVRLRRAPRRAATMGLVLAVVATTLSATFGIGADVRVDLGEPALPASQVAFLRNYGVPPLHRVTISARHDFMVSGPRRETDIPSVLAGLREAGYSGVGWIRGEALLRDPAFDLAGLWLLVRFAGLQPPALALRAPWDTSDPRHVLLVRRPLPGDSLPCAVLPGGEGMWAVDSRELPVCPGR